MLVFPHCLQETPATWNIQSLMDTGPWGYGWLHLLQPLPFSLHRASSLVNYLKFSKLTSFFPYSSPHLLSPACCSAFKIPLSCHVAWDTLEAPAYQSIYCPVRWLSLDVTLSFLTLWAFPGTRIHLIHFFYRSRTALTSDTLLNSGVNLTYVASMPFLGLWPWSRRPTSPESRQVVNIDWVRGLPHFTEEEIGLERGSDPLEPTQREGLAVMAPENFSLDPCIFSHHPTQSDSFNKPSSCVRGQQSALTGWLVSPQRRSPVQVGLATSPVSYGIPGLVGWVWRDVQPHRLANGRAKVFKIGHPETRQGREVFGIERDSN